MKKAETQEQEFLEVCSSYDHDLLTGKKEMTLKDYERITYLVSSLGYSQYLQFLIGKYMDLAQADEEREEREHEIYLEYPEYYEDEGILEEEEKWLEEFLNQLPEKKREYFEKLIKEFADDGKLGGVYMAMPTGEVLEEDKSFIEVMLYEK